MFYRFLLFVLLLFATISYIITDGLTHGGHKKYDSGSTSWDGGNAEWGMETDAGADHPTITAYASANVTRYKRENDDESGSGSGSGSETEDEYEEWGFGHSRVSAKTVTITIDGNSDTHEPYGKVEHLAYVYFNGGHDPDGSRRHYIWIEGDNNVNYKNYEGEYNEATSAYNPVANIQRDNWYLTGKGDCEISNTVEELLGGRDYYEEEKTTAFADVLVPRPISPRDWY